MVSTSIIEETKNTWICHRTSSDHNQPHPDPPARSASRLHGNRQPGRPGCDSSDWWSSSGTSVSPPDRMSLYACGSDLCSSRSGARPPPETWRVWRPQTAGRSRPGAAALPPHSRSTGSGSWLQHVETRLHTPAGWDPGSPGSCPWSELNEEEAPGQYLSEQASVDKLVIVGVWFRAPTIYLLSLSQTNQCLCFIKLSFYSMIDFYIVWTHMFYLSIKPSIEVYSLCRRSMWTFSSVCFVVILSICILLLPESNWMLHLLLSFSLSHTNSITSEYSSH